MWRDWTRTGGSVKAWISNWRRLISESKWEVAPIFSWILGETLGLSALASLASEGASQLVKKISDIWRQSNFWYGKLYKEITKTDNWRASRRLFNPQNKINQLIAYKHILSAKKPRIFSMLFKQAQVFVYSQPEHNWLTALEPSLQQLEYQ